MSGGEYYFDEDELIQDQMMEEEEEEIPYFEDNDDENVDNPISTSINPTTHVEDELREQVAADSNMDEQPSGVIPVSTVEFSTSSSQHGSSINNSNNNDQVDLYSFERYNGGWRNSNNISTAFGSSNVKTNNTPKDARSNFIQALVRFKSKDVSGAKSKSDDILSIDAHLMACLNYSGRSSIKRHRSKARFVYEEYVRQKTKNVPDNNIYIYSGDYQSTPISLFNGKRIYIRHRQQQKQPRQAALEVHGKSPSRLLQYPMSQVIQGANRLQQLWATSTQRRKKNMLEAVTTNDPPRQRSQRVRGTTNASLYGDQLWVDKYAPKSFVDLLSDERTNREFLRSLKEWDPYVFGRHNSQNLKSSKDIRPPVNSRVYLLCGNAGVGKTTLAHIAAKHAGYRPIEINASDDRSPQVLKEKVMRAMESTMLSAYGTSGNTKKPKPNCIILDEVDGIDNANAIHVLLDIIKQEINGNNKPYLRRPIIFIANHKFASALKPLLNYAKVFDVQPPFSNRIVSRCKTVLSSENMSIQDNQLLTELVNGSGGDIRSCLHTLQYVALSRQLKQQLDASQELTAALSGAGMGNGKLKDQRGDTATTLNAIFRTRRIKGRDVISSNVKKKTDSDIVLSLVEVSFVHRLASVTFLCTKRRAI